MAELTEEKEAEAIELLRDMLGMVREMRGDLRHMNGDLRHMNGDLRHMNAQAKEILGKVERIEDGRNTTLELLREIEGKMLTMDFLTKDDLRNVE